MLYIVSQTIVSGNIDGGEPVEVNWYKGESLPLAMSAMAQAVTRAEDQQEVPESVRVHTLEVRLDMQAECPWRGVGYSQRPWWAAPYVCGGREVEHPFGTLCGNHSKAWAEAQENMPVEAGATPSTKARSFAEIADVQGWDSRSRESIMMAYIEGDFDGDLPAYAQARADEENGATSSTDQEG